MLTVHMRWPIWFEYVMKELKTALWSIRLPEFWSMTGGRGFVKMRDISSCMPSSFMISTVRGQSVIPAPAVLMVSCASYKSMWISRPANFPIVIAMISPAIPAPQIATRNLGVPDESDIEDTSVESESYSGPSSSVLCDCRHRRTLPAIAGWFAPASLSYCESPLMISHADCF